METLNDLTNDFTQLYYPTSALVFYRTNGQNADTYVEYFDMDKNGTPINAHPLSVREANRLAKALNTAQEKEEPVLKSEGIIGSHILHLDARRGRVIWFTKALNRELYFTEDLGIPSGVANIPPMVWVADRESLSVYALRSNRKPTEHTKLYNAPFFNVYEDGRVCMGTVNVQIKRSASIEAFTTAWESYFFESYFSHLMFDYNPIKGNCVTLWKDLVNTGKVFPKEVLLKRNITLNDLLR